MANAPSHLDDDQVERLGELLDRIGVPQGGFNMEALDGYLSALAVGPDMPPKDEWQPLIWGEQPPAFASDAERDEAQRLILGHRNACIARARFDGEDLPESLSPLLWLPEDPEAEQPDALDVGSDWAHGFFTAVELRPEAWQAWLEAEEWIDQIFSLLEQLATGEAEAEEEGGAPTPITFKERMEIVASLPGMLADLHQYMIDAGTPKEPVRRSGEEQDRNALCACGSGKKFKKCHGA